MPKVFIGSTSRDLHAYRLVAIDECNRLGLVPIAMEYFEAIGAGATAGSRSKLDDADVYVGIFAHRYGYIEAGEGASVTELEFDHAAQRGLERLCFLVDPAYDDPALSEHAEPEHRDRMAAFRARVEASLIRQHFTTAEDFRGKVRLALQSWTQRTPELRGPHPSLSFQLLEPSQENRLRYGARIMPFVGRTDELKRLRAFLDEERGLSWLVVAGAAGSGKSRLVQELCTRVSPPWRAGFLLTDPPFDEWSRWRPEGPTLIAVDYASEQVEEIRTLLGALAHRGEAFARTPVRVILLEREADGSWMDRLIGSRSAGYMIGQARSPERTVQVGGLSDDDLREGIAPVLGGLASRPDVRDDIMTAMRMLDPERRPLFALLAADAVAAGRSIVAWDRERLLRDVLGRERETWDAHGVTEPYENLLALATATGGLTEDILDAPPPELALPSYRDLDRSIYRAMTGADLEGDALPPLKPDLLGEFFVLEHVRGRNERVTAQRAKELATAAWRVRGGSRRVLQLGVLTHLLPSSVPLFLQRVLIDYIDHPVSPDLLARPAGDDIDLHFWPDVVANGIELLADAGRLNDASTRFDELLTLSEDERRTLLGTKSILKAAFALLRHALLDPSRLDPAALLERLLDAELRTHDGTASAFARGAADAVPALIAAERADLLDQLLGRVRSLIDEHRDEQELRSIHARALSLMVTTDRPLQAREAALEKLQQFCSDFRDDVALYVWYALAAGELFQQYIGDDSRLVDAERMNRLLRSLARMRAQQQIVRYSPTPDGELPFRMEVVHDDLRTIRIELAHSNAMLIPAYVRAERHREASRLIDEIMHLAPADDADFAVAWALAASQHANAIAQAGNLVQVPKALDGIAEVAAAFPHDVRFKRIASTLALNSLKRAVLTPAGPDSDSAPQPDIAFAEEMVTALSRAATPNGDAQLIADFAEGTLVLGTTYQQRGDMAAAVRTAHAARWALEAPAAADRWRERGGEGAGAEIGRWTGEILALGVETS